MFLLRRKNFLGTKEKRICRQIFFGKIKLVSYVLKIMWRICLCTQTNICTYECLVACQSEKKYIWNWSKILCIFHFFINFFIMKTLIKSKIYCHAVSLNHLFMYVGKIVCQASLPSFLSLAIFYLDQCQVEIVCSAQHHCHW